MLVRQDRTGRPFTLAQAEANGLSPRKVRRQLDRGELTRIFQGVYISAEQPVDARVRLSAVRLLASSVLIMVDRTAALLHGVDLFSLEEHALTPRVECCVLRAQFPPRRPELTMTRRDLSAEEIELVDGLRVTTPARTALDLACGLQGFLALWALDSLSALHGLTAETLAAELTRYGRRRGVVQARRLVPLVEPASESSGESLTRLCLIEAGLPRPVAQHPVLDADGYPRYRVDLAYPWARVAIEYDGEEFHSTPEQRAYDEARRQWLREQGWTVIVVDRHSFRGDVRQDWINQVCRALGRV